MVSPHSQALKDQLNDFVRIINRQHIPSFCFFEKQKSDVGRIIKSPLVRLVRELLFSNALISQSLSTMSKRLTKPLAFR